MLRDKRDLSQMPVVFIPEETETECVAENRMSSFGFLGFVVSAVNAVVNVANNINNNNNNRNNNNNDNNNNQVNTNIANSANMQMSTSMAMTGRQGWADRLRSLRKGFWETFTEWEEEEEEELDAALEDRKRRKKMEEEGIELMG